MANIERQEKRPPRVAAAMGVFEHFNNRELYKIWVEGAKDNYSGEEIGRELTKDEERLISASNETLRRYILGDSDFIPPLVPKIEEKKEPSPKRKKRKKKKKARKR